MTLTSTWTRTTGGKPPTYIRLLIVASSLLAGSCWPGWDFLFDVTPSREHRVEDLRVLAVRIEPASIVFSPDYARDGGDPITLRVNPVLFDPRGGDIDVEVALCVGNPDGFSPCTSFGGEVVRRTVTTDANDPLGSAELDATFTLSHDDIVEMFDAAGVPPTRIGGMRGGVVVNVSRSFDGKRERERAELLFPIEVDPFGAGSTPELFEESGGLDCRGEPEGTCTIGGTDTPVCGNGVVEPPFEQCDPPVEGVCDEGCFAFDFCQVPVTPICIEPVTVNQRPVITGAFILPDVNGFPDDTTPHVDVGGVIELTPGEPAFVVLSIDTTLTQDSAQFAFTDSFCPEGSPGRRTVFECGLVSETINQRAYIADQKAELVPQFEGEQFFNPQFGPVGVVFAADTPAGTQEPLVLVASDSDGGMDLATFIVEAR